MNLGCESAHTRQSTQVNGTTLNGLILGTQHQPTGVDENYTQKKRYQRPQKNDKDQKIKVDCTIYKLKNQQA